MDTPLDVLPNRSIDESMEPIEDLKENVEELTMQPHQLRTHAQTLVQTRVFGRLWSAAMHFKDYVNLVEMNI
jgi:hypothetical protein